MLSGAIKRVRELRENPFYFLPFRYSPRGHTLVAEDDDSRNAEEIVCKHKRCRGDCLPGVLFAGCIFLLVLGVCHGGNLLLAAP